jgi:hypothetical protein
METSIGLNSYNNTMSNSYNDFHNIHIKTQPRQFNYDINKIENRL